MRSINGVLMAGALAALSACALEDDELEKSEAQVMGGAFEAEESSDEPSPEKRYVVTAPANGADDVGVSAWAAICAVHGVPPLAAIHPSGVATWKLRGGTVFQKGDQCQWGKSLLLMQQDGNFVLYDENMRARWASNTANGAGHHASFQTDGNLVVYNASGQPLRTGRVPSNTCCHQGYNLHVQSDGNVVIYAPAWQPRWATGTRH
jgi:hypothetical protein